MTFFWRWKTPAIKPLHFLKRDDPLKQVVPSFANRFLESELLFTIVFSPEDKLILMALTKFLSSKFGSNLFMNESFSHREDRNIQNYKTEIASWGKVDFLILIDLSEAPAFISRARLMAKVESVVKDQIILELLNSFLNSSLLTKNGYWKN